MSLIFKLQKQKHPALRVFEGKCLNLCQDTLGNELKSCWKPVEQYQKGIGDSLGKCPKSMGNLLSNAYREVYTL